MKKTYKTSISSPNLSNKIMNEIKTNKLLNNQNFQFNLNDIFHKNRVSMNEFDKIQNKHKKVLDKLYLESKNFTSMYYKYKDSVKDIERTVRRKKLRPISDNITQKKVNFIEKNHFYNESNNIKNIFRPSPLLLEGNELERYYKSIDNIYDINPEEDKNIKYSQKLLNILNSENRTQSIIMNRINKIRNRNKKIEEPNLLNKYIRKLKNYNTEIKQILKTKEFNTLKFTKRNYSNRNLLDNLKRHFSPRSSLATNLKIKNIELNKKKRGSLFDINKDKNRNKFVNIFNTYEKIKNMPIDKDNNIKIDKNLYSYKFNLIGITDPNQIQNIYNNIKRVKKKIKLFNEKEITALRQMYFANAYDKRDILNEEQFKDNDINNLDKELINSVSRF